MSGAQNQFIEYQANEHPLVVSDEFQTIEDYCLYLMHQRAYEEAVELVRGKKVLDYGCNNGYGTNLLKDHAASIVGVDVSSAALADAARRYPNLDVRLVDGFVLPFDSDNFDVVVSLQVIEHVPDSLRYLGEIARVLKSGGTAMFTTPNAAIRLDPGMTPWNPFHVREYRAAELSEELARVFPRVRVRGLFGRDELYKVEYRRCQRALTNQRNSKPKPETTQSPVRGLLARLARGVLPTPVVEKLRHLVNGAPAVEQLDPEIKAKFSTKDLFYRETNLHAALDLIAICRKG